MPGLTTRLGPVTVIPATYDHAAGITRIAFCEMPGIRRRSSAKRSSPGASWASTLTAIDVPSVPIRSSSWRADIAEF